MAKYILSGGSHVRREKKSGKIVNVTYKKGDEIELTEKEASKLSSKLAKKVKKVVSNESKLQKDNDDLKAKNEELQKENEALKAAK